MQHVGTTGGADLYVASGIPTAFDVGPVVWIVPDDARLMRLHQTQAWATPARRLITANAGAVAPGCAGLLPSEQRKDWFAVPIVRPTGRAKRLATGRLTVAYTRALDLSASAKARVLVVVLPPGDPSGPDAELAPAIAASLADVMRSPHPFRHIVLAFEGLPEATPLSYSLTSWLSKMPPPRARGGSGRRESLRLGAWADTCNDNSILHLTGSLQRGLDEFQAAAGTESAGQKPSTDDILDALIDASEGEAARAPLVQDLRTFRHLRRDPPSAKLPEGRAYWRVLHRLISSPLMAAPQAGRKRSMAAVGIAASTIPSVGVGAALLGAVGLFAAKTAKAWSSESGGSSAARQGKPLKEGGGTSDLLKGAAVGAALTGFAAATATYFRGRGSDDDSGPSGVVHEGPETPTERLADLVLQELDRSARDELRVRLQGQGMVGRLKSMLVEDLLLRDPAVALLAYVEEPVLRRKAGEPSNQPIEVVVERLLQELGYSRARSLRSVASRRAEISEALGWAKREPERAHLAAVQGCVHVEAISQLLIGRLCRVGWGRGPEKVLPLLGLLEKDRSISAVTLGKLETILVRLEPFLVERDGEPGRNYRHLYGAKSFVPPGGLHFAELRNRCAHHHAAAPRTPAQKLQIAERLLTDALMWCDYVKEGAPPLLPPIVTVQRVVKSEKGVEVFGETLDGVAEHLFVGAELPVGEAFFLDARNNPIRVRPELVRVDVS